MNTGWRLNLNWHPAVRRVLVVTSLLAIADSLALAQQPVPQPLPPRSNALPNSVIPQIRAPGQPTSPTALKQPTTTGLAPSDAPLSAAPQNPLAFPSNTASPIGTSLPAVQPLPPRASPRNQIPPSRATPGVKPPSGVQPATFLSEVPKTPPPLTTPTAQPGEHPLAPAIARAHTAMESIAKIQDYSATLVKRERIDGALGEHQYLYVKVRHNPFSVYIYFLAPGELKGQETIFVAGKNEGNLLAHPNGLKGKLLGTVSLNPTGMLAMSGNRYPITQVGFKRLTERLLEVGQNDMKYGECAVKILSGAKVNGRDCTCYEVNHPQPRKEFIFHIARIYLDTELNVPIRYEAYEWPSEKDGQPVLLEEYTYLNLKLNNGFTDLDFDVSNPKYQFK